MIVLLRNARALIVATPVPFSGPNRIGLQVSAAGCDG